MIPVHFNLTHKRQILLLSFLLALLAAALVWAQSDTPITIGDGSLTIESAVPWASFNAPDAKTKIHPHTTKSVRSVVITSPGKNGNVAFNSQRCEVFVSYAPADVTVSTGPQGQNLRVVTAFDQFQPTSPTQLRHPHATAKISHVRVLRDGQSQYDQDVSGRTTIVIHYQQ